MTESDADSTFRKGHAHHLAGRLPEAEQAYRAVLAVDPRHGDALHFLGVIALQCGKPQAAIELIGQSTARSPNFASLNNLGEAFRQSSRLDEALACFERAIQMQPGHVDAIANAGVVLAQQNKLEPAEQRFRQVLAMNPNHLGAASSFAALLDRVGKVDDAVSAWNHVVRIAPQQSRFHRNLGDALVRADETYRAISAYRRAIELMPEDAEAYSKLALSLSAVKKFDEALAAAEKATVVAPTHAQAWHDRALVLERADRGSEAAPLYRRAVELNPKDSSLHGALGRALSANGQATEALESFARGRGLNPVDHRFPLNESKQFFQLQQYQMALTAARSAVRLAPHDAECHAALAFALLAMGDYLEGFAEYEWRWRSATFTTKPRDFASPLWDGSEIAGRELLVHSEQGFGDIFQFLRYLPSLLERKIKVIIEVPYKIAGLVRRMSPALRVIISGTILPSFDLHVPMLSLPGIFKTTLDRLPANVPYLRADPVLLEQWRNRITAETGESKAMRVGLVWAGSPKPDPRRSATFQDYAALANVAGVSWIALQPDSHGAEADAPPAGMKILNLGAELRDFADTTASTFACLDLLITIDTSSAHLAGAMGIPTWVMLPHSPDWRWQAAEESSPWYPTVKLFRQTTRGDWAGVVERVADELRRLIQMRSAVD